MIKFYRIREPYGCFSNFSKHSILADGKMYETTEHYYQCKKFLEPEFEEIIRLLKTARKAKDIASGDEPLIIDKKEVPMPKLRADWEAVKYGIMKDALRYKADQHEDVKQTLLSTGDEVIVEDTPNDSIWGIGADGKGRNLLGKAWMEIREEIRSAESKASDSLSKA